LSERIVSVEKKIPQVNTQQTDALKKDVVSMHEEIKKIHKEIEDIKAVLVGFNKKLTKAFGAFSAFGPSEE
jgi:peptidoglycan hydrolase CwlO-like protein